MPNLYADIAMFTRRYAHDSALTATDLAEVLRVLNDGARRVDDYCDRHFYSELATHVYDGNGKTQLWLPDDLLSVTTLKADGDGDGTYEISLAVNTDYWLWPDNSTPKVRIDINPESSLISSWPVGRRRVQIVGEWGYTNTTELVASVTTEVLDASETGVDVTAGTDFAAGQTILVESEQMYIASIATNTLTVVRGVNGTTAATHVTSSVIRRYVYEEAVVGAALMWAGRLWKRRETADATTIVAPAIGTLEIHRGLDPDVRQALDPYRARVLV